MMYFTTGESNFYVFNATMVRLVGVLTCYIKFKYIAYIFEIWILRFSSEY